MSSTSLFPDIPAILVTLNGVIKLLQNLKPYKGSGPDKIPTRLLKECAKEIAPSLVLLFQASLKQSIVPTEWKHAFVTPNFKKVTTHWHQITDQYLLHQSVGNCWNILFTQI